MNINKFLDDVAKRAFNMTRSQAHASNICIDCKKDILTMKLTDEDKEEWKTSALCPKCIASIFNSGGDM